MPDVIGQLLDSDLGKQVVRLLGLPAPAELRRHEPDAPLAPAPVLVAAAQGGRLRERVAEVLVAEGVQVHDLGEPAADDDLTPVLDEVLPGEVVPGEALRPGRAHAVVLDATGLTSASDAGVLRAVLGPVVRRLGPSGRVVVLGAPVDASGDPRTAAVQQGLEAFTKSVAKELRDGGTAQLVRVAEGGEGGLPGVLRFLLSGRSAYVSGQVLVLEPAPDGAAVAPADPARPHQGRVALVTGASRGIGEAIAEVLARDGAHVVCLDLPAAGDRLAAVANRVGGTTLQQDITAPDAGARIVEHLTERFGGVDVVVHNAGITRDKTLAGMDAARWDSVVAVNLAAQEAIDDALLAAGTLHRGGRIVGVASTSGIAGNRGQANYALTKAGVIGRVRALAPVLAEHGATANAVAPGFIETEMTASMPVGVREVGRRLNALSQGGLPVDVAEAVSFLAAPDAGWTSGQTLRVCGLSLLGA